MKPPVLVSGDSKSGEKNLCVRMFLFIYCSFVLWGWEEVGGVKNSVAVDFRSFFCFVQIFTD